MIGIIDYGVGNLRSVKNSFDFLSIPAEIVGDPEKIVSCDRIVLPGVGAFGPAMAKLVSSGFAGKIKEFAEHKPILGICLGMQLLMEASDENGRHQGLGLIKGRVRPLAEKVKSLPLPHVGWNEVFQVDSSPLFKEIGVGACFYFVHSFYCEPLSSAAVIGRTNYGGEFASAINQGKIFGCQFHPEKSQTAGLQILKNFSLMV